MRKVLFIAYYFPPMGLGGVQRAVRFVKSLPEYGWEPIVLTVKPVAYYAEDPSLVETIGDAHVVRTESYDPLRLFYRLNLKRRFFSESIAHKKQQRLRSLIFPDSKVLWLPAAFKQGLRIIRTLSVDCIFSSSPPQSSHLLGYLLNRRTGIPWVLDYRDDWTGIDDLTQPTRFHSDAARWLTRKIIRNAHAIVGVSEPIVVSLKSIRKSGSFTMIPNGYDADDFLKKTRRKTEVFTLTYCGTLNSMIRPDHLFKALQLVLRDRPELRSRITVQFCGCVIGYSMKSFIQKYGLEGIVEWSGYVKHLDSVQAMCSADMLLLLLPSSMSRGMVTGKIFEYLASGRPILALVPSGEAQRLILEHARGVVIDPEDVQGIARHILRSYTLWKRGDLELSVSRWEQLNQYERHPQTEQLARVFDQITSKTY